jgi:hypothetical protein
MVFIGTFASFLCSYSYAAVSYKWRRKIREMINVANEYDIIVFSGKFFLFVLILGTFNIFCFLIDRRWHSSILDVQSFNLSGEHTVIPVTVWWWYNLGRE